MTSAPTEPGSGGRGSATATSWHNPLSCNALAFIRWLLPWPWIPTTATLGTRISASRPVAAAADADPPGAEVVVVVAGSVVLIRVIIVSFHGGHSAVEIAVTING